MTRKLVSGVAVVGSVALLALGCIATSANAAPYRPVDDAMVVERLPARTGGIAARELRAWRAELAARPDDAALAVRLTRRYFRLAMAEGDPRYIGYGEAALKPWWTQTAAPPEVLVARALLKQYRHDFKAALTDLGAAARERPSIAEIWSWRAALHLVQADYAGARRDCDELARHARALDHDACRAWVDGQTGKAALAYRTMADTLARDTEAGPQSRLWMHTRLAEMAHRLNDPARVEQHFKAALALGEPDQFLLAAYADFLLDRNRPAEVIALLADWTRADILLLRLALAEKAVGAGGLKEHAAALTARFAAAALRGDKLHLADQARFTLELAGDPTRALALARENWSEQRESRDARVLLEAAIATGDRTAAQPVLDWLRESGIEDSTLAMLAARLTPGAR